MSKKDKTFVATIYGYDNMNHEKYQCSVDYFIDNYKEFAKDDFFWIFYSKEERDSFAFDAYFDELGEDCLLVTSAKTKRAKEYVSQLKDINLDVASSYNRGTHIYEPKNIR
jgi:hypothetical protein|tara:strand:+ start:848 stop:1180 length:333 start_codon:yes stop_codon:yes gene_type:complete